MKKVFKYILGIAAVGFIGYKAVYIKKLSGMNNATNQNFDAAAYSKRLWDEKLPARLDSAIDMAAWINAIGKNAAAIDNVSNAMAIGNYRYSLVRVGGIVGDINADEFILKSTVGDSVINIRVATEFIYGNAIRDASALVDIRDFDNTNDLNNISEELNKHVRTTVLPDLRKALKPGAQLEITGAVEINKKYLRLTDLEMVPVRIKILN